MAALQAPAAGAQQLAQVAAGSTARLSAQPLRTCRVAQRSSSLRRSCRGVGVRAMVADASPESTALFAKEMERVAAKEAVLLAIKDAGGPSALSPGQGNQAAIIDVGEKLLALERLNPTPRPTSSPMLEGNWDFVWVGARSPGAVAARLLLSRFPPQLASLESLALQITDDGTKATAQLKFFNTVETTITLTSSLAAESPLKVKEEYVEGVVSTPSVPEGSVPSAVKPLLDQLTSAAASLPDTLKDTLSSGLKLPLSGRYSRELLISYLDDEVLVARDQFGTPDVLVRSTIAPALVVDDTVQVETIEYDS